MLFHSFSLFVTPMQAEFGWTTTQITLAFTIGLFCADIFGIPVGHWVDRHGGRAVMAVGAGFLAPLLWHSLFALALGTGLMTAIGGLGHTLPYLIPSFWTATATAPNSDSRCVARATRPSTPSKTPATNTARQAWSKCPLAAARIA